MCTPSLKSKVLTKYLCWSSCKFCITNRPVMSNIVTPWIVLPPLKWIINWLFAGLGYIINLSSEGVLDETGRRKGSWKEYFISGELRAKGNYLNNHKSGTWIYYFKNGSIEQEGEFILGLPDGLWLWYYESGELLREESYFNGREDGKMIEYSKLGEIVSEGNFINGEKEGEWSYFSGDHLIRLCLSRIFPRNISWMILDRNNTWESITTKAT